MNVYHKLRPRTDIESCECLNLNGLLLVDLFTDNPLHCDFCRKEIDPERLQLTVEETEAVAGWFSVASALYRLWLDSGEYEQYAKERMLDVTSQVNRDGQPRCFLTKFQLVSGSFTIRTMELRPSALCAAGS